MSVVGFLKVAHGRFCHIVHRLPNKNLYKRNDLREITRLKMSKKEDTNGSWEVEGIPLKRAEGLLLVMDTPKGAA
jgi:hypothetical protein